MNVMYHNEIDRLRVMRFLLRSWRYSTSHPLSKKPRRYTQDQLAEKAGFEDGDIISDLESLNHLADVAFKKKPRVARETLINILNKGLERSQKDIDAILWLYQDESFIPLQKKEVSDDDSPLRITQANQYTNATEFKELRSHIVDLLTKALKVFIPNPIKKDSKVQMIFELDQPSGLESDLALYAMEREPGQRLVVTKSWLQN